MRHKKARRDLVEIEHQSAGNNMLRHSLAFYQDSTGASLRHSVEGFNADVT